MRWATTGFCGRPCEKLEDRVVNPVGFADSVIVSWMTEMRKEKEKCECERHVCRWIVAELEANEFR